MPSQIDNILIQVRSRLQECGIKLWLEPYYYEGIGPIESELESLARDFSNILGISYENCKAALSELQDGALSKLNARREFESTGNATFKIRAVRQEGSANVFDIKLPLTDLGSDLLKKVAQKLEVEETRVKLICAGKVVKPEMILREQGLNNNSQLMALVGAPSTVSGDMEIYDRVKKTKEDAERILESKEQTFFRMEDQDGNAVHLPPHEHKSLVMAMALYEKGRAALKRDQYDESLVLLLEADQQFSSCDSKILQSVDNYALLNLDIVWCYLCLKSVTHLPDAQRRLQICEQSFRKSYGENLDRVVALKGNTGNEKALIMRLHLLQGVVLFHQNRRNEAYEKFSVAETELRGLKVDDTDLLSMVEMGYNMSEARIALRACNGNLEQAINFITERKEKKRQARKRAKEENEINKKFQKNDSDGWVNPRSVHTLVNMGFDKACAYAALKKSKNDLSAALDMLQNNQQELMAELPVPVQPVDEKLVEQIVKIGFNPEMAKIALESVLNNSDAAIDLLLKMQQEGNYSQLTSLIDSSTNETDTNASNEPGTSFGGAERVVPNDIKKKIKREMEALTAFQRFSEDFNNEEDEYLDLPLVQEENILFEYKHMLEQ